MCISSYTYAKKNQDINLSSTYYAGYVQVQDSNGRNTFLTCNVLAKDCEQMKRTKKTLAIIQN